MACLSWSVCAFFLFVRCYFAFFRLLSFAVRSSLRCFYSIITYNFCCWLKEFCLPCWWSHSKISVRLYASDESIHNVVFRLRSTYIQKNILLFSLRTAPRDKQTGNIHWYWTFAFRCQWLWIFIAHTLSHGRLQSATLIHMLDSQTYTDRMRMEWTFNKR